MLQHLALYTGTLWPNGEGSIGRIPRPKPRRERDSSFESTNVPISHKTPELTPRGQRGEGGLTAYGRRMVRNGAFLLEQHFDRRQLAMLTVTMPAIPKELRAAVLEHWPEAVRQFTQWIKRALDRHNVLPWLVGVTEVQTKRGRAEGWSPPHLHLVVPCLRPDGDSKVKNEGSYLFTPGEIRAQWRKIWERFLMHLGLPKDTYWGSCENVKRIRKSPGRYLSKYISKGSAVLRQDDARQVVITGWWHMSLDLKQEIWVSTEKGPSVAEIIHEMVEDARDCFEYLHTIFAQINYGTDESPRVRELAVGYVFKLVQAGRGNPGRAAPVG